MRTVITIVFLVCTLRSFSQEYLDKKIIIVVSDTTNIYQKVRQAFGRNNFQLKEDGNISVVTTFPRESKKIPGYVVSRAIINKDTVAITGIYGFIRLDYWGYTRTPNNYKDILYMNNSKLWPLLMNVAKEIGSTITYSK